MSSLSGSHEHAGTHGGERAAADENRRSLCWSLSIDPSVQQSGSAVSLCASPPAFVEGAGDPPGVRAAWHAPQRCHRPQSRNAPDLSTGNERHVRELVVGNHRLHLLDLAQNCRHDLVFNVHGRAAGALDDLLQPLKLLLSFCTVFSKCLLRRKLSSRTSIGPQPQMSLCRASRQ